MVVYEKELTLSPKDEKTNISLPFTVPAGSRIMYINFTYSPKLLDDRERAKKLITECLIRDGEGENADKWEKYLPLVNLVTLSLYSPEGFVGAAHRHNSKQNLVISGGVASKGFFPCEIKAGQWKLMLNVHAIVSESCECKIQIKTRGYEDE